MATADKNGSASFLLSGVSYLDQKPHVLIIVDYDATQILGENGPCAGIATTTFTYAFVDSGEKPNVTHLRITSPVGGEVFPLDKNIPIKFSIDQRWIGSLDSNSAIELYLVGASGKIAGYIAGGPGAESQDINSFSATDTEVVFNPAQLVLGCSLDCGEVGPPPPGKYKIVMLVREKRVIPKNFVGDYPADVLVEQNEYFSQGALFSGDEPKQIVSVVSDETGLFEIR